MLRSRSTSRTKHPIRIPGQQHQQEHAMLTGSTMSQRKPLVARMFLPVLLLLILILMGLFLIMSSDTYTFVFRRTDPVARLIHQRLSERSSPNKSTNDADTSTTGAASTVRTTIRVFGPDAFDSETWAATATSTTQTAVPPPPPLPPVPRVLSSSDGVTITMELFTRDQQRDFLQQFGSYCQPAPAPDSNEQQQQQRSSNLLLEAFDRLAEEYGRELWKYCVLYTGLGNVYWEPENITPLVTWSDLLMTSSTASSTTAAASVPTPWIIGRLVNPDRTGSCCITAFCK
jgi:hypothetical protein